MSGVDLPNPQPGDLVTWADRTWRVRDNQTSSDWLMCESTNGPKEFVGFTLGDFSPRPDGTEPKLVKP